MKQTLTLTRNDDDDAIFRANAADADRVDLNKISLVYASRYAR